MSISECEEGSDDFGHARIIFPICQIFSKIRQILFVYRNLLFCRIPSVAQGEIDLRVTHRLEGMTMWGQK